MSYITDEESEEDFYDIRENEEIRMNSRKEVIFCFCFYYYYFFLGFEKIVLKDKDYSKEDDSKNRVPNFSFVRQDY